MRYDSENEMFRLATELINQSSRNIFLTGKAGTGKTTFLKYIRETCPKQMAVVAPTGVAAINAGGVTIHSFFQLPLSPFIPEAGGRIGSGDEAVNRHTLISRLRLNRDRMKLLRELELLVIDEISMVRCDTMDAIDTVLRHVRRRPHERFGGVQVLLIGDMFQLPPVARDHEWQILSEFYNSPFFFDSIVIKEEPPVYIEFNKIYRQSEERFIELLNQVRNNNLDERGLALLQERVSPAFRRSLNDGYIILTTHNETARNINAAELANINEPVFTFTAEVKGEFAENSYPADESLKLKVGAQVMFIKNDIGNNRKYYNGKIGEITSLSEDKIMVKSKDDPEPIEVAKEQWENIRYTLNRSTRQMEEEELGVFTQYPLRLAWAITIHKSQGLTFEKAIIDAGKSFASGQVYVALSRCTNLEGLVLKGEVRPSMILTDQRIVQFARRSASSVQIGHELKKARKHYEETLLLGTFDFRLALNECRELKKYIEEHKASFNTEALPWAAMIEEKIKGIQDTAEKFHTWLRLQFEKSQGVGDGDNDMVTERSVRAADHFVKELNWLIEALQQSSVVTDSRMHAKEFNEGARELFSELTLKRFLLQGINGPFSAEAWHNRKKSFVLPAFSINAYAVGSERREDGGQHRALNYRLRKLRDSICEKNEMPIYMVAGSRTIDEMVRYLPQSLQELRKISGFGDVKIGQYGQEFLDIILEYSQANGLGSLIHEKSLKPEKKESKGGKSNKLDTKAESLKLYKEGIPVSEIAKTRNLTTQTIERHLCHYVAIGEIGLEELVDRDKLVQIEPAIEDLGITNLTAIKQRVGESISYGEIRLVIAWQEYQKSMQGQQ